jgi:hypothetical protein
MGDWPDRFVHRPVAIRVGSLQGNDVFASGNSDW